MSERVARSAVHVDSGHVLGRKMTSERETRSKEVGEKLREVIMLAR